MITQQLQKGIESLEQDFYDELQLNNEQIIQDRVEEIEEYLYYQELEEQYNYELEYEIYLIEEELSEFYNFIDTSYPK